MRHRKFWASSVFKLMFALSWGLFSLRPQPAYAWNKHVFLMPWILKSASPTLKQVLSRPASYPCSADENMKLTNFIREFQLSPNGVFPSITGLKCNPKTPLTLYDLLVTHSSIDDPDNGMDRDLPTDQDQIYDPNHSRQWMGGSQGFPSQGFRHMYFGGERLSRPITTFQYPFQAIGQAPERAERLARKAKELIKAGDLVWGTRLLGWAAHYIQDLNQPFHTVQVIHLKMVPWQELIAWPPRKAWKQFLKGKERTITNFHWAYEGYTLDQVLEGKSSLFTDCLSKPKNFSHIHYDPKYQAPLDLAFATADASVELASELGSAEVQFFGARLLMPDADMTQNPNLIDFKSYAKRPDLVEPREEINRVTCRALANTALGTLSLFEWAFQP